MKSKLAALCLLIIIALAGFLILRPKPQVNGTQTQVINVGYFPNITHAQALIGLNDGTFQKALGDKVEIKATAFNAGPSEVEALFAGDIDIGYIGPGPAVNGFVKSQGQSLKIISGVASGGASLVLQPALAAEFQQKGAAALEGKKIASPQQGNTQDLSLRHFLAQNNLSSKVQIVPMANADQLTAFAKGDLDGSWAPEPWATKLVQEAKGVRSIDERDLWPDKSFTTACLIVRTQFLKDHADLVKEWLAANNDITTSIQQNPQQAMDKVNSALEKLTGKKLATAELSEAWSKLDFSVDPGETSIMTFADWARNAKFIDDSGLVLTQIFDFSLLNELTGQEY